MERPVTISPDVHGQTLKGNTLLPEKLILEKGACGLVRPVHESRRHSKVLIFLAVSVATGITIGMTFANVQAALLCKVHTAQKGLLHEKGEPAQVPASKEQACETR